MRTLTAPAARPRPFPLLAYPRVRHACLHYPAPAVGHPDPAGVHVRRLPPHRLLRGPAERDEEPQPADPASGDRRPGAQAVPGPQRARALLALALGSDSPRRL